MSTFWTPDGERPIRPEAESAPPPPQSPPAGGPPPGGGGPGPEDQEMDPEMQARMAEMTEQMVRTPAEVVVANHAYGLFELAALHLSQRPPQLDQARIAIDAMSALIEGMSGRLGEAEGQLGDGLSQLRMAFVEISKASAGSDGQPQG